MSLAGATPPRREVRSAKNGFDPSALRTSRFALVLLLAAAPAHAQWIVEASAGGAVHEALASEVGTRSAVLGVRREGVNWLYLAAGLPLDTAGLPWAAGGTGARLSRPVGALVLGADVGAHGYGYRDRGIGDTGAGATLEGFPFVSFAWGASSLELYSGLLHHSSTFADTTASRTLHDSGVRLRRALSPVLAVHAEGGYARATEDAYPYVGGGLELARGRVLAWGSAGAWLADAVESPVWSAGASYEVGRGLAVYASAAQETNDPLYWNAPRRSWSVGVSRRLGAGASRGGSPAASVVPPAADGRVTLRIPLAESPEAPAVAGDFTGWEPVEMTRAGDYWEASLSIAPGRYAYSFRRPDGSWFVPESITDREDDGFGGTNAVLLVP